MERKQKIVFVVFLEVGRRNMVTVFDFAALNKEVLIVSLINQVVSPQSGVLITPFGQAVLYIKDLLHRIRRQHFSSRKF